jgi:hypothetical protein
MNAVQIIDLKTGTGADASAYGFSATDGFTAPKEADTAEDFADEDDDF